mmetsp:Transcript_30031/g.49608  ORF Transcript_30031/g.49608 Transcript_30031/m.49608 type:complete len:372 (-) Transcript_30031:87-1202(-)|eukprot:CAMPEP_0119015336 /NCGR_PEP_ID=MMETSP1176-20130426/10844_1 /TAXON_ID=265551 /ORGANISM="Synedropsis recta cf, Strain CCMP1620" /LENGTH=371 /DNA_ID=CAMNT_0006968623 /DNA_START=43 /DNA_END=1158 /DNA_ORIENTATION=+
MMFRLFSFFLLAAAAAPTATATGDIKAKSTLGRTILQHARSLEGQNEINMDFVTDYSLKFQGCHHVSQWNGDVDDEDDVRIKTKRLVRFRLCPTSSCQNDRSAGCTTKFGDYVVDLNTFVAAYLDNVAEEKEDMCYDTATECAQSCNNGDDEDCMTQCYADFGMSMCLEADDDENNDDAAIDVNDYAECAQYEFQNNGRRLEDGDVEYYMGPYCADQGGEIHLGIFTDDTCTTFLSNGEALFYTNMGYELPYSDTSIISNRCLTCSTQDEDGEYEMKELCQDVYQVSGKCETKMNVEYPNESACTYIEGIKIIREDGVIRTSSVKKSKAAAVCIGVFLTVAVLLAGYVYYLRTKLGRAKINLSAASQATLS